MPAKNRKSTRAKTYKGVVVVEFGFDKNRYKPGDSFETKSRSVFDNLEKMYKIKPV